MFLAISWVLFWDFSSLGSFLPEPFLHLASWSPGTLIRQILESLIFRLFILLGVNLARSDDVIDPWLSLVVLIFLGTVQIRRWICYLAFFLDFIKTLDLCFRAFRAGIIALSFFIASLTFSWGGAIWYFVRVSHFYEFSLLLVLLLHLFLLQVFCERVSQIFFRNITSILVKHYKSSVSFQQLRWVHIEAK